MRWIILTLLAMFLSLSDVNSAEKGTARGGGTGGCASCHKDFASSLPVGHPAVRAGDITTCVGCHQPGSSEKAEPKPFAARIHRAHLTKSTVQCTLCHTWAAGKSFGVRGAKVSFGKPGKQEMEDLQRVFRSWASSSFLDALHAKSDVTCGGCHGRTLPSRGDTVENNRCLACHPGAELAAKTRPADFPNRNPHESHLGEIACTVCHHAHVTSKVYCLECHPKFSMKIAGGAP